MSQWEEVRKMVKEAIRTGSVIPGGVFEIPRDNTASENVRNEIPEMRWKTLRGVADQIRAHQYAWGAAEEKTPTEKQFEKLKSVAIEAEIVPESAPAIALGCEKRQED